MGKGVNELGIEIRIPYRGFTPPSINVSPRWGFEK